jgi:hypothetical protein
MQAMKGHLAGNAALAPRLERRPMTFYPLSSSASRNFREYRATYDPMRHATLRQ